jgi:integrase|nr:MAG TPA: Integrase [Caudoviricetes sp.]
MEVFLVNNNFNRRRNGTGTVVFLGKGRYKPYAPRLLVGKDEAGKPIYFDIDTFEAELDALVCLENWNKNPYPLKIDRAKYDRITIFTCFPGTDNPYPLVPVDSKKSSIHRKDKTHYTFKQVFEEMQKALFPDEEEIKKELEEHIKPENKYAYHNSRNMLTAYHNSVGLYDIIYRELRTSDFQKYMKESGKTPSAIKQMVQLYKNMDKYAFQEDIIDKCYAQHINKTKSTSQSPRKPFTYEQIEYLWNIEPEDKQEEIVKDILLLANYTGCRAEELCFIYTKNIHLDDNYFVGGLKTDNGINREIPIHPLVKYIFEKYYDPKNEFLFMKANGKRLFYADYNNYYNNKFIKKHEFIKGKTAHCGRHGLETELKKLNVKSPIVNSILGHKNGNVGDDVYNDITIEEKLEAIKMVTFKAGKIYVLKNERKTS